LRTRPAERETEAVGGERRLTREVDVFKRMQIIEKG
jgi:hypothetical protein